LNLIDPSMVVSIPMEWLDSEENEEVKARIR
jgi:hypothetical protein